MTTPDQEFVYHPWQPDDYAETEAAVILPHNIVPVVPAYDLPRALAWTVARALRLNPECGIFPIQGQAAPTADGANTPPEAAVFDLTAVPLETASETRTLDTNRQAKSPRPLAIPARACPRCRSPQHPRSHSDGGHYPVDLRQASQRRHGIEDDICTDLAVSGRAGDDTALAAFSAGSWLSPQCTGASRLVLRSSLGLDRYRRLGR